jgi:hypothetical protein
MKKIFFIGFLLFASGLSAQSLDEHARTPAPSPIEGGNSKQQKKAEKKKAKQKEELNDAIKKGRKRHLSYQEKATRKRMKKSKRKANKWNSR